MTYKVKTRTEERTREVRGASGSLYLLQEYTVHIAELFGDDTILAGGDFIEQVTALFALRNFDYPGTTLAFRGLLSPTETYVQPYCRAALYVQGLVWKDQKTKNESLGYRFQGSFASVDDSGLVFIGPWEEEASATKRYHAFEAFVRESHPRMPTLEQVEAWGHRNGVRPDLY